MTLARPMTQFWMPGGETVSHDLAEHAGVEADVARRDGVDLALLSRWMRQSTQLVPWERTVATAADQTPQRNAPMNSQVERDVDERRNDQIVQGPPAVAEGVKNARAHVVEHRCQHAEEVVAEVFDRLRHDLRVGVHPGQKRRREEYADERQQCADTIPNARFVWTARETFS